MGCESSNPKLIKSKTFFNINRGQTNINKINYQNFKTPVKLEFTLEGCESHHQYLINVIMTDSNDSFSTEEIKANKNIATFNTCYICDYFFERQQYLNIKLIKDGVIYGSIKVVMGIIVGSPKSTYKTQIGKKNENIVITAQSINDTDSYIDFDFVVRCMNYIDFGNNKNKLSYNISNRGKIVYQSESISNFGKFEPIRIPIAILEPDFTVSFLNSNQEVLTFKDETIATFTEPRQNDLFYLGLFINNNKINIFNNSKIFRHYTFIDYIKNGVTIKLTIGIDFTSSNLSPDDPNSLHYLGGGMNDYELAIRACGTIVAYYDYNQLFPLYGFGAIVNGETKPNMCFHVNFQDNPNVYTIDNVIKEYHNCFQSIILAGPTEFCPLIKKVNDNIRNENNQFKYHILMILTDGIIVDQQQTIDALVEGSFLPLSVIIIGIGNDHFQEMIQLDGDDVPLISSNGVKRMRDLVQFVPFNKYKNDPNELAAQVLEEIPRQIMEYYTMNNIYPDNLAMSQFNKSKIKNVYQSNHNSYNKYLNDSNITYKNFININNNKDTFNQRYINQNIKSSSNDYTILFNDERESKGTGTGAL